jgi:endonuclease/exonuclease/phosphatase (EEP) superfamily protein YafD
MSPPRPVTLRFSRWILISVVLLLGACIHVPKASRIITSEVSVSQGGRTTLDPSQLRVASWNVHKAKHEDLPTDLTTTLAGYDLLLLQEATPNQPMRAALNQAGFCWQMVSAFSVNGLARGVLVASKAAPIEQKAMRTFEPLFPLPKSTLITRFRLQGRHEPLAVANLHGINFSLGAGRFRQQLEAAERELAHHQGPLLFGGDFNAWTQKRHDILHAMMNRLGLQAVEPLPDGRRLAFGRHLDYLFVRGFTILESRSPTLQSSDHNPILVRLSSSAPKRNSRLH